MDERRVPSNGYVGEAYGGYGGVRATILEEEELELPGAASTVETPTLLTHGDEDRVKMTCHVCFSGWNAGYCLFLKCWQHIS